jgi:Family of unknown function (DUF6962)
VTPGRPGPGGTGVAHPLADRDPGTQGRERGATDPLGDGACWVAMESEVLPALTDLALGLVTVWLAVLARTAGVGRYWQRMLWWAATAALAGAIHHGFVTRSDRWAGPSWAVISAMIVVAISYALAASVQDVLGPGRGRVFWVLRTASLVAYGTLAAFGHYGIATIVACEGVTMVCVLALWVIAVVHGLPGAQAMMIALAANVVAGVTRALPAGLTEIVGLDPISLYHVAQVPALVMLYLALVRRVSLTSDAGRDRSTAPIEARYRVSKAVTRRHTS